MAGKEKGALSPAQKKKIISFAKKEAAKNDAYHDFSHLLLVAEKAVFLAKKEGADKEVCWASAMLHDICKCRKGNHGTKGAEKAAKFLKSIGVGEPFIKKVHDCIYFHNKGFRGGPMERQALWDADKLFIIGPYWFVRRHLKYQAMKKGEKEGIPFAIREYRFFEIRFHTKTAKKIVAENAKIMHLLFRALLKEHGKLYGRVRMGRASSRPWGAEDA
jgi:putative nucleotidyltransferase with HDIG domain